MNTFLSLTDKNIKTLQLISILSPNFPEGWVIPSLPVKLPPPADLFQNVVNYKTHFGKISLQSSSKLISFQDKKRQQRLELSLEGV